MIGALVATGWLEHDLADRLIVHDWWEHADDAVQARLARTKRYFVRSHSPKLTKLNAAERTAAANFFQKGGNSALPEPLTRAFNQSHNTNPCASPDGNARDDALPSINDPPFGTTEPNALFPVEKPKTARISRTAPLVRAMTAEQESWFAQWWAEYWLHKAKKAAREAFRRHIGTAARFEQILTATRAQKPEMLSREPAKRPHGASWLNGERWEDETATPQPESTAEKMWSDYPEYKSLGRSA